MLGLSVCNYISVTRSDFASVRSCKIWVGVIVIVVIIVIVIIVTGGK